MDKHLIHLTQDNNINLFECDKSEMLSQIENKTHLKYPRSFKMLVKNYEFDSFLMDEIIIFGNSGSGNNKLIKLIFRDKFLSKCLIENGFLQFAKLDSGNYDPICFNTNVKRGAEYEIVRLDHEAVLCHNKITIIENIAPSFRTWINSIYEK